MPNTEITFPFPIYHNSLWSSWRFPPLHELAIAVEQLLLIFQKQQNKNKKTPQKPKGPRRALNTPACCGRLGPGRTKVVELPLLTPALHLSLAFPPATVTLFMAYKTSITLSNNCCHSHEIDTVLLHIILLLRTL